MPDDYGTPAPDGQVYVCAACGKTSSTKSGWVGPNLDRRAVVSRGWDESCMTHAVLCYAEKHDGKWRAVPDADG